MGESGGLRGEEEEEDKCGGEGVWASLISGEYRSRSLLWNHLLTELTIPPILVVIFIHRAAPKHTLYTVEHHTERATEPHPYSG